MILTQKNQSTWRQTCPGATGSTTNPTCTDLGLNPGPHYERSSTKQFHGQHRALRAILLFVGHIYCCIVQEMNGIPQIKIFMKYQIFSTVSNQWKYKFFFSCFGFSSSSPVSVLVGIYSMTYIMSKFNKQILFHLLLPFLSFFNNFYNCTTESCTKKWHTAQVIQTESFEISYRRCLPILWMTSKQHPYHALRTKQ